MYFKHMKKFARRLPSTRKENVLSRFGASSFSAWPYLTTGLALLFSIPIITIAITIFSPGGDVWSHLSSTVLPDYLKNSFWLMVWVGAGVLVLGVGTAWLVTMYRFPGSRVLTWLLILPMAVPAYLMAYTYTDFLSFTGPLQSHLRSLTGWGYGDYWFPNIRSLGGAAGLMSFVFYPYVYLLTRSAFLEQSSSQLEAARSLGSGMTEVFFRIALPLARPSIAAGAALVLMETLNDFGTVDYFGIQTFTTGIYRTWFGLGERVAAAQLSACLMFFILMLILLERWSRRQIRGSESRDRRYGRLTQIDLTGWKKWTASALCFLPVIMGFVLPVLILLNLFFQDPGSAIDERFVRFTFNSVSVALLAGGAALGAAVVLAYGVRLNPTWVTQTSARIGSMGYAIPGSVIAVGLLIPFGLADRWIGDLAGRLFGVSPGLLLSGTLFALIFAYVVRFLAVAYQSVEAGLGNVTRSMDEAASGLGSSYSGILRRIHIPMISGSLLTALLLVMVDVLKELPATLIVRPFNFDTLAVQVYRLASDERLAESSGAALVIVLVGLIPVYVISKSIASTRKRALEQR